jgi:hypothetical protein
MRRRREAGSGAGLCLSRRSLSCSAGRDSSVSNLCAGSGSNLCAFSGKLVPIKCQIRSACEAAFIGVLVNPNIAHSEARASAGKERIAATKNAVESTQSKDAMYSRR